MHALGDCMPTSVHSKYNERARAYRSTKDQTGEGTHVPTVKSFSEHLAKLREQPVVRLVAELREFWLVLAIGTYQTIRTLSVPDLDASFVLVSLPVPAVDASTELENGLLLIHIENHTSDSIDHVEVVAKGVRRVDRTSVSSSSHRLEAEIHGHSAQLVPGPDGSLAITSISHITPKTSLAIAVHGVFVPLVFGDRVHFSSSADSSRISEQKVVGGIAKFLDDYAILMWMLLGSAALIYGLRRRRLV
jgi:hypothetical protein